MDSLGAANSSLSTPSALPNPYTPLAWLSPKVADSVQGLQYVEVATAGAWVWDILMGLADEVRMFRRQRHLTVPDVVYILARIATGCFVWTSFALLILDVPDCDTLVKVVGAVAAVAFALNSLLFLFRIYAIFYDHKLVKAFFSVLWFGVLACSVSTPFALSAAHIGTTKSCLIVGTAQYASASFVAVAVNDTLVCVAITAHIMLHFPAPRGMSRIKAVLSGKGMGHTTRMLLRGGLQYYFATVGLSICTMIAFLTPRSLEPAYFLVLFAFPDGFLINAMASRVYRQLKLGGLQEIQVTSFTSLSMHFRNQTLDDSTSEVGSQSAKQNQVLPPHGDSSTDFRQQQYGNSDIV